MFTHLHTHTEFSLLDGSNKIKSYLKYVKELGMTAAAITDHGVMYGVIDFYKTAKEMGIKPILGCEVYVAPGSRFDREPNLDDRYYHLVLLAENNKGYENLMKIVSKGFIDGFYYKPRVDMEVLQEYHEGLIALSGCLAGEVQKCIVRGQEDMAREAIKRYQDCFGKENFFLEIQDHGIREERFVATSLLRLSKELGIDLVATNDIHYTYPEDAEAHDVLLCLQTGKHVSDENRMRYDGGQYYVKSEEEMRKLFPYAQEAIDNTNKIAERCNVEIEFGVTKMPKFPVPEGYDEWTYINYLCEKGLKERFPNDDGTIKAKIDYELSVIKNMGFVEYFLIVWDFINYAKENDIPIGPGRGSAAGSYVAYCLKITDIDPGKYSLLFERFLNPERVSMPDIDVDICYERRDEVIEYVSNKYGHDNVSQIVTFGTLGAKMVIRDVGRAYELPYSECNKIAKMIPKELNITIKDALEKNPELSALYEEDENVKKLLDISMKLEGLPRHTSMHAAGVVIYRDAAENYVPLAKNSDGVVTTQYVMTTLEELGLLKMDFLGLRTLTVVKNAVDFVKINHGIDIDISKIDLDDKNVLKMIGDGKCNGVFQLESNGMQGFMKELQPEKFEDIIAGISLYRPGPMDFIPNYIKGKNNPKDIHYACPELVSILSPTYGCIVYQEQVMQIFRELAGYTMGQSDNIRRAMSKKKQYVIDAERKNFVYGNEKENIKGCVNNGITADVADSIYDSMVDFAKYAFNKSHAAAYAVVAMQTAYLKCYYPVEYKAALCTSVIGNSDKLTGYIVAAKKEGMKVLNPSVNKSYGGFSVEGDCIRFGLAGISAVGMSVIEKLVADRKEFGEYKDFPDFVERATMIGLTSAAIENIIYAGGCDEFGLTRKTCVSNYPMIVNASKKDKKSIEGQMTLFDMAMDSGDNSFEKFHLTILDEYSQNVILENEKEVTGLYLSGHPLDGYEKYLEKRISHALADFIMDENDECNVVNEENVIVGGLINSVSIKYTKNGNKPMAFIVIEDLTSSLGIIIFPKQYERYKHFLQEGNFVFVEGKVSNEENENKVLAKNIYDFANKPATLWIRVDNIGETMANDIKNVVSLGKNQIVIYENTTKRKVRYPNTCEINGEMLATLKRMYGKENVMLS